MPRLNAREDVADLGAAAIEAMAAKVPVDGETKQGHPSTHAATNPDRVSNSYRSIFATQNTLDILEDVHEK